MDLKSLLKKTENKNKANELIKIRPFSIAMEDRPYDELLPKDTIKKQYAEKIENPIISITEEPVIIENKIALKINEPVIPVVVKQKKVLVRKQKEGMTLENKVQKTHVKFHPVQEGVSSVQEIEAIVKNIIMINDEPLEEPGKVFLLLSGWQKKIVDYFFEITMKNNSQKIGPITIATISQALQITPETLCKTLQRLKGKKIISTICSKEGRGGWSIFEFNSSFYQELISNARIKSGLKTEIKQPISHVYNTVSSPKIGDVPEIWANLEFQDLSDYGLTKNHLIQIYKDQEKASVILDLESMQHALDAFKFDMENNSKTFKEKIRTQSPTSFLINILSKGRPYNSFTPEKFKTPEQIAILQYKEKKEQINKELQELKDNYYETEYQSWYEKLSENDAEDILTHLNVKLDAIPEKVRITFKVRALKDYFSQFVWADVLKQLRS